MEAEERWRIKEGMDIRQTYSNAENNRIKTWLDRSLPTNRSALYRWQVLASVGSVFPRTPTTQTAGGARHFG